MSLRQVAKTTAFAVSLITVSPLIVLSWLEKKSSRSEILFSMFAQFLALFPGIIGVYLRSGFYYGTLDSCSWQTHFGFGSVFTHRGATVAPRVSTGVYCVIGHADIGREVRMASRISIPSGKRQHLNDEGQLDGGTRFDRVSIGRGAWLGENAVIMADVGERSIVSAGAVVVEDMPGGAIVGGNPAKVLKIHDRAAMEGEGH